MVQAASSQSAFYGRVTALLPGLALCLVVAAAAHGLESLERFMFGRAWLEMLVLAIIVGALIRTLAAPNPASLPGISWTAKIPLEIAVVLLGAAVNAQTIRSAGPVLIVSVLAIVPIAIAVSYMIGRRLGLPQRMALLVACGNAICGNSAIAAVAPVIGASGRDVGASIAFTAVFGVVMVLALPLLGIVAGLDALGYGALAGLTVYAVPQVIAAAAPFGPAAIQFGTLVKLLRVLMLGPVCLVLSLIAPRLKVEDGEETEAARSSADAKGRATRGARPPLHRLVPWFVLGFIALAALRSLGALPEDLVAPLGSIATFLTILSMAALGLQTDLSSLRRAGGRVSAAAVLSLLALTALALAIVLGLHIA
nr:putative sulfate exporter family transporter [Mangrovicella endophytica]